MTNATVVQIVDAIALRLAAITQDNGYATNAGARVYKGREHIGDDEFSPEAPDALTVLWDGEQKISELVGCATVNLAGDFAIVAWLMPQDPTTSAAAIDAIVRDAKRALFRADADPTLTTITSGFEYMGAYMVPRLDGLRSARAALELRVTWRDALDTTP
ncbi:MAG: hypothetical protein ACPHN2_04810 [Sinimarinibacterium flocculans]|uniref:hypothetical protein n=1 Tax=Sinimarinibacterium flocculans TaxID=985250 RepID=UPI003C5B4FF4